ncbi:hypothetical protein OQG70_08350 [Streptococcus macedonicus]|uniref:hypothetical protein n=1 Tax=Streptococcus macedonicus TaxID=59310 RepID=UPI002243DB36|nr:hypothetical protein [Streptococcus macedonicus]MCW8645232.1 hypothetical protein [Streptococcus macedonicus]
MKEFLKEILKCRETSEIPKKLLNALLDADSREHILQLIKEKKDDEIQLKLF